MTLFLNRKDNCCKTIIRLAFQLFTFCGELTFGNLVASSRVLATSILKKALHSGVGGLISKISDCIETLGGLVSSFLSDLADFTPSLLSQDLSFPYREDTIATTISTFSWNSFWENELAHSSRFLPIFWDWVGLCAYSTFVNGPRLSLW